MPKPNKPFYDYEQVEYFGKCSLPIEDMALILDLPLERIQRVMARENSKFNRAYRRGQAFTKLNILQRQIAVAIGEAQGNPGLLTHLGAILLGQNTSKKPAENIQKTAEELVQNVSEEQKAEMFNALMGEPIGSEKKIDDNETEA